MTSSNEKGTVNRLRWYRAKLPWFVLGAVVIGAALGATIKAMGVTELELEAWNLRLPGTLFLRALSMVVVPLIIAAIVTGVSGAGDLSKLGRMGLWTVVFYLGTTAVSVGVGLVLVNLIKPGVGIDLSIAGKVPDGLSVSARSFGEFLSHLVSVNPIGDAAADLGAGRLLPLLLFCVLFGGVMTTLEGKPKETLTNFFDGFFQVMMKITDIVILFTPLGVFFLLLDTMAHHGLEVIKPIALFGLTVMIGLLFHAFVVLPLLLKFLGKRSAAKLSRDVAPALLTAFSTCSSSATLPLTIECATENAKIPARISNFIIPLGSTVNMDGTALYEAVAALFIAQAYGIDLSLGEQASVLVMAVFAAVGTAGIPSASLVMIAIVLGAVGLPLEGIGLIMALDRLLDMARTTVNVWGDVSGAALYESIEKRGKGNLTG